MSWMSSDGSPGYIPGMGIGRSYMMRADTDVATHGGRNAAREIQRLDGILELLRAHLDDGGSPTDEVTARLYIDYYGTGRRAIDIDAVARWAERHTKGPQDATSATTD